MNDVMVLWDLLDWFILWIKFSWFYFMIFVNDVCNGEWLCEWDITRMYDWWFGWIIVICYVWIMYKKYEVL